MARRPSGGDSLKRFVFNGFSPSASLAFLKLRMFCWNKIFNQIKTERKIMKLIQCERPGLAWPRFGRLAKLQEELDHLFESPLRAWAPVLDVREDADNFIIRAELPGLKRDDISVSLQDGALVITGERTVEKVEEGVEVHRQERCYGKFQRILSLPTPVTADQIKAQYKDGVLTVTLPKAEEAKPKQIDISVN
jgi:HSP20 family protein